MSASNEEMKKQLLLADKLKAAEYKLMVASDKLGTNMDANPKFIEETNENAKTIEKKEEEIRKLQNALELVIKSASTFDDVKDFEALKNDKIAKLALKESELKNIKADVAIIDNFNKADLEYKETKDQNVTCLANIKVKPIDQTPSQQSAFQQFVPAPTKKNYVKNTISI